MMQIIRMGLGFLIGLTGFISYVTISEGHDTIGIIILVLGYLLALVSGALLGLGILI